ncbi:MAG: NAD(P)H-dependent oxidoreductase subunit E [Gemmatimonadetes bacterium]|nr:NAD(P)H-dependent oxidoreductase subunit E [Gemmatimonadota bacterium]
MSRYPNKRAALLPVLNLAHEIRGYLSQESMDAVAHELEEAPAAVRGVATFYTMYNRRPVGRHLVQVCTNVACNLCGGHEVFEAFLQHTGTEPGQISEDGEFTVMEVECLGACGFPTAVQVNGRYFENVDVAGVPDLLARLKRHGVDPVDGAAEGATSTSTSNGEGTKSKSKSKSTGGEG